MKWVPLVLILLMSSLGAPFDAHSADDRIRRLQRAYSADPTAQNRYAVLNALLQAKDRALLVDFIFTAYRFSEWKEVVWEGEPLLQIALNHLMFRIDSDGPPKGAPRVSFIMTNPALLEWTLDKVKHHKLHSTMDHFFGRRDWGVRLILTPARLESAYWLILNHDPKNRPAELWTKDEQVFRLAGDEKHARTSAQTLIEGLRNQIQGFLTSEAIEHEPGSDSGPHPITRLNSAEMIVAVMGGLLRLRLPEGVRDRVLTEQVLPYLPHPKNRSEVDYYIMKEAREDRLRDPRILDALHWGVANGSAEVRDASMYNLALMGHSTLEMLETVHISQTKKQTAETILFDLRRKIDRLSPEDRQKVEAILATEEDSRVTYRGHELLTTLKSFIKCKLSFKAEWAK